MLTLPAKIYRFVPAFCSFMVAMLRWRYSNTLPSFHQRKLFLSCCQDINGVDQAAAEHVFGPGFVQSVLDKNYRRRMAVYKTKEAVL